jgi:putative effector of murein hydrolase
MNAFILHSGLFGCVITLGAYVLGLSIGKKVHVDVVNPLLISVIFVICFLKLFDIDYVAFRESTEMISKLLTPATVSLAIPLYQRRGTLKRYLKEILLSITLSVLSGLVVVTLLSSLFRLSHVDFVTLLPKSVTTAIGMGLSEEMGGNVTITVAVIIVTGILGSVLATPLCRLFHITSTIAKGIAIGTSAHAIGTAKAMSIGEEEGAMSSLSLAVSGLLTVILAPLFSSLL